MKTFKILVLCLLLFACDDQTNESPETVSIRIHNNSFFKYESIQVGTSTGFVSNGDLNSGKVSEYQTFKLAYRYAFVELEIDGETYTLQPIDYVREEPLDNGNYTYSIKADIKERYNTLSLNLMYDVELLEGSR